MFKEMANIFPSGDAEKAAAPRRIASDLKIDEGRRSVFTKQNIRFFGQIIVYHTGYVDLA